MAAQLNGNPWLEMWTHPRETIRSIVKYDPKYRFFWLSALYGLPLMFNIAQSFSLAERFSLIGVLLIAVILSVFVGMIGISIGSLLVFWTGRWIGGKSSYDNIRAAVAWSNVTNIVNLCVWLILLGVFGNEVFLSGFAQKVFAGYQSVIIFLVFLAQAVVAVWSFVILINGISEVQGFSNWKALLNIIIPFVMVVIVLWVLGWLFYGSQGMVQ